MVATSNQETNWKEARMAGAERITDIWDIVKAYAGRSAEVVLSFCMFVSIIGVLPGVHYWPFVNNLILSVQIIMLDMGGFALTTMAEHARDNGQDEAAQTAERMGRFLIALVIATLALITIGQLASIAGPYAGIIKAVVSYAETSLILVRVVSTVQYIHVIHSLRGSTLAIEPTSSPLPDLHLERIEQLEETIKKLNERLTSIMAEKQQRSRVGQPTSLPTRSLSISEEPTPLDVPMLGQKSEAALEASVVQYPVVPGVSERKVKELIDAFLGGAKWSEMKGNYSQTIKPVRDAYERFVQSPSGV